MSLTFDEPKIQKAQLKSHPRLQQELLDKIQRGLQDIGLGDRGYSYEETEYLCFRCYHKLLKQVKALSFGPPLFYCSNDDCLAGSFYEHEAKEMTRRIYRDV